MAPVSSIMHRHEFRILRYLDDWLVLASSFREIVRKRDFLLWHCCRLSIMVSVSKSSLDPSQTRDYLGMTILISPLRVFPTLKRVQRLFLLLQEFHSDRQHPVSVWRRLLGVMSSMSAMILGSCLRMRSLQLSLNASGPFLLEEDLVSWDDCCLPDLRWWSEESIFWQVFHLARIAPTSSCTPTPRMRVGAPLSTAFISPACGLPFARGELLTVLMQ